METGSPPRLVRLRNHISKMRILYSLFGLDLIIVILCSGCALAQQGGIDHARSKIKRGDYQSALVELVQAERLTTPTPAIGAEISYLKGICYQEMDSLGEANAMFKFVVDHFPETAYGYLAKARSTNDDSFMSVTGPLAFTSYDKRCVKSVKDCWYRLLEPLEEKPLQKGTVIIKFNLHDDGEITELKIVKNTTSALLASICQKAVSDSAPFEAWPPQMLEAEGKPRRAVTFTFKYRP